MSNEERIRPIQPAALPPARGYSHGMLVSGGRTLYIAGQVGWEKNGSFSPDFPRQFERALECVVDVVRAAGGGPEHIVKMTVFVTDIDAYRSSLKATGEGYRRAMGRNYPAMALIGVAELVIASSLVEIEAIASLPDTE